MCDDPTPHWMTVRIARVCALHVHNRTRRCCAAIALVQTRVEYAHTIALLAIVLVVRSPSEWKQSAMTTANKTRANTPELTLENAIKAFNATYASLSKSVDGQRAITAALFRRTESDDASLMTLKFPNCSAITIRRVGNKYERSAFTVTSFDKNGRLMTYDVKAAKELFPTLDKAFNSAAVALGRQFVNVIENMTVDSSVKTTRRSDAEVTAQRERADAAEQRIAELEKKIADLLALQNNK